MQLHYYPLYSKFIEICCLPELLIDEETLLSVKQKDILLSNLPIKTDDVLECLQPLKSDIKKFYFKNFPKIALHLFNVYVPETVQTFTEGLNILCALSSEQIIEGLAYLFHEGKIKKQNTIEDVYRLITQAADALSDSDKWKLTNILYQPKEMIDQLCDLLLKIETIYDPFYQQMQEERTNFGSSLTTAEALINQISIFDNQLLNHDTKKDTCTVCVLSPFFAYFLFNGRDTLSNKPAILLIGTRMVELLNTANEQLDDDTFHELAKILGDATRYKVMLALSKGTKTKDIAETLKMTSAAVSYHTNKLASNLLLIFQNDEHSQEQPIKYLVNKDILRALIQKLETDFDLNE
ncbi:hypothetical protein GMA11_00930 [Granulicatella sp. zg-ZJ]|uniref:ArsR/SmtB family transcription factor n=1 Tax=Granulicatella sp. zg-ZJ TaxID=2678504 RepID=UPI0013D35A25|nr:winged helix-turn-helix domain-containing protein [Granulicatella sp. zg-ZJ]NEW61947.1 hypothetical protein [Granulicatella sp. zg-ZJ]